MFKFGVYMKLYLKVGKSPLTNQSGISSARAQNENGYSQRKAHLKLDTIFYWKPKALCYRKNVFFSIKSVQRPTYRLIDTNSRLRGNSVVQGAYKYPLILDINGNSILKLQKKSTESDRVRFEKRRKADPFNLVLKEKSTSLFEDFCISKVEPVEFVDRTVLFKYLIPKFDSGSISLEDYLKCAQLRYIKPSCLLLTISWDTLHFQKIKP